MKMKLTALLCLAMFLMSLAVGALAAEHSASASIDLVFDGMTFTDTVQVEWNERYVVPEGGVKWDGKEDFIGFADRDNWQIVDGEEFSYVAGQILFMAKEGTEFDYIEQLAAKYGARIVAYIALTETYVIELCDDKSLQCMNEIIGAIEKEESIEDHNATIHRVDYVTHNKIPNDPWGNASWNTTSPSGKNWNIEAIKALEAWEYEPFMKNERVGIIDSMFIENHEDIQFDVVYDLNDNFYIIGEKYDEFNHGTHVTGTAIAIHDNEVGISGVFPKGTAVAIGFLGDNNAVYQIDYMGSVLLALMNHAKVINISMGFSYYGFPWKRENPDGKEFTPREYYNEAVKYHSELINYYSYELGMVEYFERIIDAGYEFVIVNSAGNDSIDSMYNYWCQLVDSEAFQNRLITVGSVGLRNNGEVSFSDSFSNWGHLDVVAPGEKIYSTVVGITPSGGYEDFNVLLDYWKGTSMSAPHVTGVVAMMMSIAPDMSGAEIKEIIINKGTPISDGHGNTPHMLDAYACVREAFARAKGTGVLNLTISSKETNQYIDNVQVIIKPLEICQETETISDNIGSNYPYSKQLKLGKHQVMVSKEGYTSYVETITVTRDSIIDLNVTLKPTDAPQITKGTLNGAVTFNSAGVNGIEVDVTRGTTHVVTLITNENGQFAVDLEPGQYVLSINENGYAPVSKETVVFTGKTTTENIGLKQNKGTLQGTIVFNSFGVENAKVDIKNGESVVLMVYSDANGQFIAGDLPAGEYVLSINEDGYVPVERSVEVLPGEVVSEVFTLELDIPETPVSSFTWRAIGDTEAAITGYVGNVGCVRMPETIEGRTITAIDNSAFENNTILEKMILPDSITTIGTNAFKKCTNLTYVNIPEKWTTVTSSGFTDGFIWNGCSKLTSITVPEGITRLPDHAFRGCSNLQNVVLPSTLKTISYYSFEGCSGISEIVFPDSLTEIGQSAFVGCTRLQNVELPEGLLKIGIDAFAGCTSFTKLTLPDSITTIGIRAFQGCANLTETNIPKSWTTIEQWAGALPRGEIWADTKIEWILVPEGVVKLPAYAFENCRSIKSIILPSTLQTISKYAFCQCTGLEEIEIPAGVQTIGSYVFDGCSGSMTVIVTKGSYAESYCIEKNIPHSVL